MIDPIAFGEEYISEEFGISNSQSLLIEGDNLDACDTLLDYCSGMFRVVYLDPPYNTGLKFRFKDDFSDDSWTKFMEPRLRIMAELLAEDGAIFVSIDDREIFRLGALMDNVFGRKNRLPIIIWEKKYGKQNNVKTFSLSHEYILCYAKNIKQLVLRDMPRTSKMDSLYKNRDRDPRGSWKSADFSAPSGDQIYPITLPSGRVVYPPTGRAWLKHETDFKLLVADNRIWFGKKGDSKPQVKLFMSEVQQKSTPGTLWPYKEVGHTDGAKKELKKIMDASVHKFEAVKPTALIRRCIDLVAGPDDWILDAFGGTGTTAHAVLQLNDMDRGNRKFVLIESGNGTDKYCRELTVERIRRTITGEWRIGQEPPLGGGFRYVRKSNI